MGSRFELMISPETCITVKRVRMDFMLTLKGEFGDDLDWIVCVSPH